MNYTNKDALLTFQNLKSFLQLLQEEMKDNGRTDHKYFKMAKKLDSDLRDLEQSYELMQNDYEKYRAIIKERNRLC